MTWILQLQLGGWIKAMFLHITDYENWSLKITERAGARSNVSCKRKWSQVILAKINPSNNFCTWCCLLHLIHDQHKFTAYINFMTSWDLTLRWSLLPLLYPFVPSILHNSCYRSSVLQCCSKQDRDEEKHRKSPGDVSSCLALSCKLLCEEM